MQTKSSKGELKANHSHLMHINNPSPLPSLSLKTTFKLQHQLHPITNITKLTTKISNSKFFTGTDRIKARQTVPGNSVPEQNLTVT